MNPLSRTLRMAFGLIASLLAIGSAWIGVSALSVADSGDAPVVEYAEGLIALLCALGLAAVAVRSLRH
jgi:hypothetical protein